MDTFRGIDNASYFPWRMQQAKCINYELKAKDDEKWVKIETTLKTLNADASAPSEGVSSAVSGCLLILTVGLLLVFVVCRRRVEYRLYRVKQILRQQTRRWKSVREDETLVLEDKKFDVYL